VDRTNGFDEFRACQHDALGRTGRPARVHAVHHRRVHAGLERLRIAIIIICNIDVEHMAPRRSSRFSRVYELMPDRTASTRSVQSEKRR